MKQSCKHVQLKLLLSQFDDDVMKHISQCETCWNAFMNIGLNGQSEQVSTIEHKQRLLTQATDPAFQGDHRMEQFQLLSSLQLTSYAKQLFLEYFSKIEGGRAQTTKAWTTILAQLEDAVYSRITRKQGDNKDAPVDAEVMMGVLDDLGDPGRFLHIDGHVGATTEPHIRRMHRSSHDKMLAGVCGGMGEYFRIDPLFIRILFVALAFLGGWTIPIYIVLYLFLPVKSEPQPVFTQSPVAEPSPAKEAVDEAPQAAGSHWLWRMMVWSFVLFLCVCVYAPLLLGLGLASVISAVSVFEPTPWGPPSMYGAFSFGQLGIPGMIAGGSLSLLFFSLFLLVLSFVLRLHFKKILLGKNLQAIFIVFVIMSFFSTLVSAGVLFVEHKEQAQRTITRTYPAPKDLRTLKWNSEHFLELKRSHVPIKSITFHTQPDASNIKVSVSLTTRGKTEMQAQESLKEMRLVWPKEKNRYFPLIKKPDPAFHFEHAEVKVTLPPKYNFKLEGSPFTTKLQGTFAGSLSLRSSKKLHLRELRANNIVVLNDQGKLNLYLVQAKQLKLINKDGKLRIDSVRAQHTHLYNDSGKVRGEGLAGKFSIKNEDGKIRLKLQEFQAGKHVIENDDGKVRLYVSATKVPKLEVHDIDSDIDTDDLEDLPKGKGTLVIRSQDGKVQIHTWYPDSEDDFFQSESSTTTTKLDDSRSNKNSSLKPKLRIPTKKGSPKLDATVKKESSKSNKEPSKKPAPRLTPKMMQPTPR